jgi:hypothetical protein
MPASDSYQHQSPAISRAERTAAGVDFDSPLMRLAAGGPPRADAARRCLIALYRQAGRSTALASA